MKLLGNFFRSSIVALATYDSSYYRSAVFNVTGRGARNTIKMRIFNQNLNAIKRSLVFLKPGE